MNADRMAKIVFVTVSIVVGVATVFVLGLDAGANRTKAYALAELAAENVKTVMYELPVMTHRRPVAFLQPSRHKGSGVTVNETGPDKGELILLVGFFDGSTGLRLIRRDGTIVAKWPVAFSKLLPEPKHGAKPATDWNVDLHGAVALPDGSVVFNFEYGGLVKLDRCGRKIWSFEERTHHSVERAAGGGFWVPTRKYHGEGTRSPFPPIATPFYEDQIVKISEGGRVLKRISVPGLFYDNGLQALLTSNGNTSPRTVEEPDEEIVHLNNVEELPAAIAGDFPSFDAGDLLVSLREFNLLMVVDPDSHAIKWWQIGPWLRQHDPDFQPGGRITMFNNNSDDTPDGHILGGSSILSVDPETGKVETVLGGNKPGEHFFSNIRGVHQMRPGGGVLVTEFEGGRIFETDANGHVIWEYINRYDKDTVIEMTGARIYPPGYFKVADWSCNSGVARSD